LRVYNPIAANVAPTQEPLVMEVLSITRRGAEAEADHDQVNAAMTE